MKKMYGDKPVFKKTLFFNIVLAMMIVTAHLSHAAESIEAGSEVFRFCAPCHSLELNQHMTGPSLAGIWGRKSGTVQGFPRYSPALKASDIIWDKKNLEMWLEDPQKLIPDNQMTFQGIKDNQARIDLIAFLQQATQGDGSASRSLGSKNTGQTKLDLKKIGPDQQIKTMRYRGDTYYLTTTDGSSFNLWEYNVRIKTDSSGKGPSLGHPAIVPANMMGDRVYIIFSNPSEISAFIKPLEGALTAPPKVGRMKKKISQAKPDLKKLETNRQIKSIQYCGDTYQVTTVAGSTVPFWEYNLRLKTDSSEKGSHKGIPTIVPSGMQGDRASIVFSDPSEISRSIESKCEQ